MAGIYIHIPFCKQTCHYCDFHFSTSLKRKNDFLEALLLEIELQKDYLGGEDLDTIYFGGGTPSLLESDEVRMILGKIGDHHNIAGDAEITLEANPDDLIPQKVKDLAGTSLNRLSIGIQSFFQDDLEYMNRAHSSEQAEKAIEESLEKGFENLTVDLIYGTPTMTNEAWLANLNRIDHYNIPHLSAYALTVENYTPLEALIARQKRQAVSDEQASSQFEILLEWAAENDFEQYEISNFAKDGLYSRHNSGYWLQEKFLGLGPSAHSYNGKSRQWNIPHNIKYIKGLKEDRLLFQSEKLSAQTRFNEYILTGLRTKWGVDLDKVRELHGEKFAGHLLKKIAPAIEDGFVERKNDTFTLSQKGKLFADAITADLFY